MNSFILLISLIIFIILGLPIPVAMGISILIIFVMGNFPLYLMPQILIAGASNWSLLAVPFFIISGGLMNELGVTVRLFNFARAVVGHIRGGLAHVNILASMIFAGISGSAIADIGGIGKIEMKAMTEAGFNKKISAGITIASSVIGPIIPPSIGFVLYGVMAEESITRLFLAGVVPGILIGITLMIFVYFQAVKSPKDFPIEKRASFKKLCLTFKDAVFVLMAPVIILLGMTSGLVSPTEAGAVAILYTIFVGFIYKEIRWTRFWTPIKEGMIQSAHAISLVALASVMGYIMTFEKTPQLLSEAISHISSNPLIILLIFDIFFLIAGCFMAGGALLVLLTPIFLPVIKEMGVDPIHFGIIIVYALTIGLATPPVGIGLFVLSDIAKMRLEDVISGVIPYLFPLIVALLVITYCPKLCLWLPSILLD